MQEIGDIDLSQIDPTAQRERIKCPRCEQGVLEEDMASHMNAHSSEPWSQDFLRVDQDWLQCITVHNVPNCYGIKLHWKPDPLSLYSCIRATGAHSRGLLIDAMRWSEYVP